MDHPSNNMARIPTIQSKGNVRTGQVSAARTSILGPGAAPQVSFAGADAQAAAGRAISGGLQDLASGVQRRININDQNDRELAAKAKERQAFDNHLWSESQYTTAQRDWIQWSEDVQKNGSEDVVQQFKEKFSKYESEMLATAPNEDAQVRLKLKLQDLGTRVFDGALKVEASNRAKNTVNTFTQMFADTQDLVVRDPYSGGYSIADLEANINQAREQNRIPEETFLRMKEQVRNLSATQAEAMAPSDPVLARAILENAEGIDWARRKQALNVIERAEQTNDTLAKYQSQETFKSHLDSIMETGQGVGGFTAESYAAAFPAEQRPAIMAEFHDRETMARSVHAGKIELQAKSPGQVAQVLEKYRPEAGDAKFNDKQAVFAKLNEMANAQVKLYRQDPFSFSRQDPVVDRAWDMVEQLPADATPQMTRLITQQALESSISFQRNSGIPEGRLSAMSTATAGQYAQRINQGNIQQVQEALTTLQQTYGKYYPQAFRDLVRLPEGQRIDASTQVVALHMGKPFLADFIAAVRTPASDMKLENKDMQQLRDRLVMNPEFMAFRGAMLSANPGAASMVSEFSQSIEKYASSIFLRGNAKNPADAVKQATELVIGSAYGFTEVNGTHVAVKLEQDHMTFTDADVRTIGTGLTKFQRTIESGKIDSSRFAFPANISEDMRSRSIGTTLHADSFWVTNPQNDGATLYMTGMEGSTAPIKWKDGRAVEVKFDAALQYGRSHADPKKSLLAFPLTGIYPILR